MALRFLSLAQVIEIQHDQIVRYGGESGTRDTGLLKSALAMPSATFDGEFLHHDIFEMAAAYLFHIVQNHPFVDGNKRVGVVAAGAFLILNGYELTASWQVLVDFVLTVARGERSKTDVAGFLRKHAHPVPTSPKGNS
jgi:death-on-curing protein